MTDITYAPNIDTPAEKLVGLELQEGWRVIERIERAADATGGYFSVGYLVEDSKGRRAFLKALNFSRALLTAPDPLTAMTECQLPLSTSVGFCTLARNVDSAVL